MALFDNLKGKFTQVGQDAIQRTREMSEVARLESRISSAKDKINGLYGEIGYRIYMAYSDKPLPEVASLLAQVSGLHAEIDQAQVQINAINSATTCPRCKAKIDRNAAFCSECGLKIIRTAPNKQTQRVCVGCGKPLAADVLFCSECGTKQPIPEPADPQPADTQPVARACSNCGASVPADSAFCPSYGNKME
ncbi:MAG: zinc ribbon domain-containing protein [Clostridiales bacterium]|nr:zinc ribbon domain-containing protein [Clostridiales bacterium]